MLFLHGMVSKPSCVAMLNELDMTTKGNKVSREPDGALSSALQMIYTVCKKAELNHAGYSGVHGMNNPIRFLSVM